MLTGLHIRDVVLIEKLDLDFGADLNVFTGETGAGKSILLDSLSLALGARGDSSLVRSGAKQLSVCVEFALPADNAVFALLDDLGIPYENGAVALRRVVTADGKSKAFVNDTAVGVGVLKQAGDLIVEIHGQFASFALLNPASHGGVLDSFGGLDGMRGQVKAAFDAMRAAQSARDAAAANLQKAQAEEDFVRHALDELTAFDARVGEEEELAEKRTLMMNAEKLIDGLKTAQDALAAMDAGKNLRTASRALDRINTMTNGKYQAVVTALDAAAAQLDEAGFALDEACGDVDLDGNLLESVEERLFDMRALARKYQTDCDGLSAKRDEFQTALNTIEKGEVSLDALDKKVDETKRIYAEAAEKLSRGRRACADALDAEVRAELEPLKLGKAVFVTQISPLDEAFWGATGKDKVVFTAATNAGQAAGALNKIASGGELSRFMLALKVVLGTAEKMPTMVFDEVDAGVGGATAFAVGERLAKLCKGGTQVLVVTHSPQVAAFGAHHFRVSKSEENGRVLTDVTALSAPERREEIARMLAGTAVTDVSRAAAEELLKGKVS